MNTLLLSQLTQVTLEFREIARDIVVTANTGRKMWLNDKSALWKTKPFFQIIQKTQIKSAWTNKNNALLYNVSH